ncbi:Serine/threonine-protein kinase Nek2 [Coelomomyces lativittatus]|nr:Serine/threonine-protein kinase Nek2 [Coelomomyces lativittatus]
MSETYEVLSVIGSGSFGRICKVRRISDGKILARKEIDYKKMKDKERRQLVQEVNLLREFTHPNIVRYYSRYVDKQLCFIFILMEFCEGGDLASVIQLHRQAGTHLPEEIIWSYLAQLSLALYECHHGYANKKGIMESVLHRDIKPENVFLDAKNNIKLGDFGLSTLIRGAGDRCFAQTFVGTPFYMSPELINETGYNTKSDIWALGCLIYELCNLEPPFRAHTHHQLHEKIRLGQYPKLLPMYSKPLRDVVSKLLQVSSNEVRRQLELFEKQQRHRHRALVHQQVEKDHQYITHRFHHMLSTSHVQGAYHRPLSSLAKTTHSTPSPTPTTLTKWKKSTAFLKKKTPEHVAFYVHRPLSPSTPLKRPKLYSPRHLHSSSSSSFPCKHTHILPFGKFSDSVGYLNQSDVMIHDSTILQSHPRTSHSINAHVAWVLQQAELRLHLPPSSRPTSSHPTSQGSWPPSSSFKFTHHKDDRGRSTSPSFTNAPLHPVQPILLHPLVKKKPNLSDPLKQNPSKILHLDPLNPKHMQHVPERWKKRVSPKPSSTT